MKGISYILLVGMVFMGLNRFVHGMDTHLNKMEMSCDMDCCTSQDDCEQEADSSADHTCPPGCDCDCCFHITAIFYQFIPMPAVDMQSHHFAAYSNSYQFEYFIPPFEPPRRA